MLLDLMIHRSLITQSSDGKLCGITIRDSGEFTAVAIDLSLAIIKSIPLID